MRPLVALVASLAGCAVPVGPAIDRVEPASGPNTEATPVQILGSSFHLPVTSDIDDGKTAVGAVSATAGAVPLDDVVWVGNDVVVGAVPSGMAIGPHDIVLTLGQQAAVLPSGFTVVANGWRKPITIPASAVQLGPHVDFPLLVHLASDVDLAREARPDGFDITFTDVDGTELAYERERFEPTTGELIAWVAIPTLSSSMDTVVYLRFGDPGATSDRQKPTGVWGSYQGVWHLDESTAPLADSTMNANQATAVNGPVLGVPGKIGRAVSLNAASTTHRLRVPASPSLSTISPRGTFELWINWTNAAAARYQRVMISSNVFAGTMRGFEWSSQPTSGNHYFYPCEGQNAACPANNYNLGPNPYTNQTWHHAAVTFDFSTKSVEIFVDGAQMLLTDVNVPTVWTNLAAPEDWLWGSTPNASGYFEGMLDEIRVSNTVRSHGWIATEHANQRSPATFYTVGPATSP